MAEIYSNVIISARKKIDNFEEIDFISKAIDSLIKLKEKSLKESKPNTGENLERKNIITKNLQNKCMQVKSMNQQKILVYFSPNSDALDTNGDFYSSSTTQKFKPSKDYLEISSDLIDSCEFKTALFYNLKELKSGNVDSSSPLKCNNVFFTNNILFEDDSQVNKSTSCRETLKIFYDIPFDYLSILIDIMRIFQFKERPLNDDSRLFYDINTLDDLRADDMLKIKLIYFVDYSKIDRHIFDRLYKDFFLDDTVILNQRIEFIDINEKQSYEAQRPFNPK